MRDDPAVPLDTASLDTLLAQRSWIRSLARSLVRDPSTVDDIEQEVYVAALRGPKVETSLRGWLRTVVKNAVYQRHRGETRRTNREQASAPHRPPRSPAAIVAEADSHRHVVQAVMELDEPYRTTVVVRYFEGLTQQETADRLGVPRETVKTRMRRAHGMLRERLRREHGDERGAPAILVPLVGGPAGLSELLRRVPDNLVGARPWTPLAAAAGLVVAASLVGVAVHASTGGGDGDDGVVFAVAQATDDPDPNGAGDDQDGGEPTIPAPDERRRVGDKPPAEDEPEADPAPTPPPAADHFVVRDLYTEKLLPGVALKITHGAGLETILSDASGRIDVAPDGVTRLESGDGTWVLPGAPRPAALVEGVLWLHRTAEVDVSVVGSGSGRELDLASVQVLHLLEGRLGADEQRTGPGSIHFNTRTGLDNDQGRHPVSAAGTARISVPVLRGLRLSAVAPGWRTGSAAVEFDEALRPRPVTLQLSDGVSFDGRVTNADGVPVAGAEILMKTARHIDATEIDLATLRAEGGGGISLMGSETKGWDVSWQARVPITPRGIFQGRVTAEGDVLLIVTAPGHVPKRVPLGRPTTTQHKIEITLKRPDPALRTLLELSGAPVKRTKVLFHDVTDNPQISAYVETDDDGCFPSEMLVEGRRYTVGVRVPGDKPHELRLITWDRRKTITVERLSQDFEGDDE